jgi:hypothetical protein
LQIVSFLLSGKERVNVSGNVHRDLYAIIYRGILLNETNKFFLQGDIRTPGKDDDGLHG